MKTESPLDELFIDVSKTQFLVDSSVWKKLLRVLEQHKYCIEELENRVKILEAKK